MRFNTIRFKASILYTSILAIILIAFGGIICANLQKVLYSDLDEDLEMKAQEIVAILNAYEKITEQQNPSFQILLDVLENEGFIKSQKMIIDDLWHAKFEMLHLKDDYINILNIKGNTLVNSNNFSPTVANLFKNKFPVSFQEKQFASIKNGITKIRAINLPVIYQDKQLVLQIGTPLKKTLDVLNNTVFLLCILIMFILLLTSFLGGLFAEKVLIPVKNATNVANRIVKDKDLSIRVEEHQVDEEMHDLVTSFNNMINQLELSFRHVSEFSSHVAHELKTPLAITKGEIEVALDQERDSNEYKRVLNDCLEETNRMIRVIKDLLLLAKIDYKPEIFKFEKLVINQVFEEIFEQSKILASEKNIEVTLDLPKSDSYIKSDKVHIRRLFLNLISNAVKYTPSKGKIDIAVEIKESMAIISIKDTGEGIEKANLDKIFDKFFRVHKDDINKDSTGLGLNIAKSIVQAHHGEITVESEIDKGTTFRVSLPLA